MKCPGPISLEDQGIEFCETCDDCTCCSDVDHSETERCCVVNKEGRCVLVKHDGRSCTKNR